MSISMRGKGLLLRGRALRASSGTSDVHGYSQAQCLAALIGGAASGGCAVAFGLHSSQQGQPQPEQRPALDASDPRHPYKRTMYLMRGVPASGKSTVAHSILKGHLAANGITGGFDEIAPLSRGFLLSTDDFFSPIDEETGAEKYEFDVAKIRRHHERNRLRCELAAELGMSPIIVDNTNTCAWEMRPYVELGKQYGYNILVEDVIESQQLTFDIVKERLAGRQASTGKEIPLATVERMLERYEKLPSDPEAAIAHILQSEPPWAKKETATKETKAT